MNAREISIDTIGPEGMRVSLALDPETVRRELKNRGADDVVPIGPLSADLTLRRDGDDVTLSGQIFGRVMRSCVKCLAEFPSDSSSSFSVKLVRGGNRSGMEGHEELELKASDLDMETFDGEHVDLAEIVYEQLLLTLPEYPQCSGECRGLCPECGADLNKDKCSCREEKPVDPRLAALLKLKKPQG